MTYDAEISGEFWDDIVYVYRQDKRDLDSNGDSLGLRAVASAQAVQCRKHDTDNYDTMSTVAGQSKQNNIFTSDVLKLPLGVDIRAQDVVKIVTSDDRTEWFTISGAPKSRTLIPHIKAYLTTTPEPTIVAGSWAA